MSPLLNHEVSPDEEGRVSYLVTGDFKSVQCTFYSASVAYYSLKGISHSSGRNSCRTLLQFWSSQHPAVPRTSHLPSTVAIYPFYLGVFLGVD